MTSSVHVIVTEDDQKRSLANFGPLDVGDGIFSGDVCSNNAMGYGTTMKVAEVKIQGVICVAFGKGKMLARVVCNDGTYRQEEYKMTPDLKDKTDFGDIRWVSKNDIRPF
jgi:hypothetical protein